jgi:very-long-chain enoyl-CoA reductase
MKREYETLFVHRFSAATMPVFNIFKNSFHYWVLCGLAVYFNLHPDYTPAPWVNSEQRVYGFAAFFVVFELMNFQCHCILRDLRPPGTTKRGFPEGCGFGVVTSANYFYESMAWLTYAAFSNTVNGWLFYVVSTGQMCIWALKKKAMYKKDFPEKVRGKKSMFPFII